MGRTVEQLQELIDNTEQALTLAVFGSEEFETLLDRLGGLEMDLEDAKGNHEVPYWLDEEDFEDNFSDVEADADTLRTAGWGTDEDYGHYGAEEF